MENIVQDHEADFFLSHSHELDEDLDTFCEIYNPVAVCNDPIPEFEFTKNAKIVPNGNINITNCSCMLYNRKRVFNLLDQHIKHTDIQYDCIISYRLDLMSYGKLDYKIGSNILYIPKESDWGGGINDQVAYGTYEPMKVYMNTFNNLYSIVKNAWPPYPELINKAHLELEGIKIERVKFDYEIIRGGHSINFVRR